MRKASITAFYKLYKPGTMFTLEDWKRASSALVLSKGIECEVVDVEQTKEGIIVTLKGFREDKPEGLTRIMAEVNGRKILDPIVDEDYEYDTFAEGIAELNEPPLDLIDEDNKTIVKEEENEVVEETIKEKEDGMSEEDENLLTQWVSAGLPINEFVPRNAKKMKKIIARAKTPPKTVSSSKPRMKRMNKFIDSGTFIPIKQFLLENGLVEADDDLDKATQELLNAFVPFIAGCEYSSDFRKVRDQLILKEVKAGITEMYRRIISAYPGMVKWGLVEDAFILKVKE